MFRENSRTTCETNRDLVAFFPIRFLFSFFPFFFSLAYLILVGMMVKISVVRYD